MPVLLTYPGVYIEEIPSGVRTITGVATSITAFLGRTRLGSTNEPITINSFGDFERQFGGLAVDYPLSYAVRDFYLNGGSQAIIVRLFKVLIPVGADDAAKAQAKADTLAKLSVDGLVITAKSPGIWGKKLRVTIDVEVSDEVRTRLGLVATDALFNLTIRLGSTSEKFLNVTVTDNARRIDRVLKAESSLVDWNGAWPSTTPTMAKVSAAWTALKALKDALNAIPPVQATIDAARTAYEATKVDLDDDATKAEKELAAALAVNPQVPVDITAAQAKITAAEVAMKGSNGVALDQITYEGTKVDKTGLYALDKADLFNLLCIPPDTREGDAPIAVYQTAMSYCKERRAMLIVGRCIDN